MKSTLTLFLAAFLTISLFSCHKKDDDPGSALKVKIIGSWDEQVLYDYWYKNGEPYEMDTVLNEVGDYAKFEFRSDQTLAYTSSSDGKVEKGAGSYRLNGNKLSLFGLDPTGQSSDTTIMECEINGSQMTWTQEATISGTNGETNRIGVKIYFVRE
jgi:hypothetical protein